jgi:hypothetical protein
MTKVFSRFTAPRALVAYNGAGSGLGNRVRVVLGCRVLAEFERRRFFYVWPTGRQFEPTFTDLWDYSGGIRIARSVSRALARLFPYQNENASGSPGPGTGPLIRQIHTGGEIVLPPGARSWKDDFRALHPVSEIAAMVSAVHADELAGQPYVGVQIRAHPVSHQVTKDSSPVDWYARRMLQIVDAQPDTRFFVSCDVPEVFHEVVATVPNCVGITAKGPYNSLAAVRAAIADLYLLAGSGYLIGPYGSSFVHLAENLADSQLVLETARDRLIGPVDFTSLGIATDPLRPAERSTIR